MEIKFIPRIVVTKYNAYHEGTPFRTLVHAAMTAAAEKYCNVGAPAGILSRSDSCGRLGRGLCPA